MKTSFFSLGTYLPLPKSAGWPTPPALYEPKLGVQAMDRQVEQWAYADELGYDWVSFSEHHYLPNLLQGNAITCAAAASQVVKRAKLAVLGPIVAFNNPVRIAEEIGILDNLSGGRAVVLFLRSGGFEYATYTSNVEESRERTQEATELIIRAVTEPQPFGWEGKYFRFRTIAPWPTPVQKPHPPFFYSGNSFESASFAARHRLGLACSFYSSEYLATIVDYYIREAAQFGWTPGREHVLYRGLCCIGETDAEAAALADPILNAKMGGEGGLVSQAFGRLQWQGGPATVVEQCRELHDIGFGTIDVTFVGRRPDEKTTDDQNVRRQMKLFADEVMPKIRAFEDRPDETDISRSKTVGAK
jgi:alkanesulfonate monooxygenase SsuD/methylene tetrahydromethanopterin reductase-like flavin-dependent oxidoreductase (luciferase family)